MGNSKLSIGRAVNLLVDTVDQPIGMSVVQDKKGRRSGGMGRVWEEDGKRIERGWKED